MIFRIFALAWIFSHQHYGIEANFVAFEAKNAEASSWQGFTELANIRYLHKITKDFHGG